MGNSKSTMGNLGKASQVQALAKFLPVGFGFRPTDVELVSHYLKGKISGSLSPTDILFIPEVDVYSLDPCDLQGKSIFQSGDKVWYYFVPKCRKYPGRRRQNRATKSGHWKATGEKRPITNSPAAGSPAIGEKRTFVFYKRGGVRTPWIIHEYCTPNDEDAFLLCQLVKKPEDTLIETRKKRKRKSHENSSSIILGESSSTAGFSPDAIRSPFSSTASTLFVQPGGGTDMEFVSSSTVNPATYHEEQEQDDLEADLYLKEFSLDEFLKSF